MKQVALAAFVADAESIGADAVVAIKLDYEAIDGDKRTLLMVFKNGTAVKLKLGWDSSPAAGAAA